VLCVKRIFKKRIAKPKDLQKILVLFILVNTITFKMN